MTLGTDNPLSYVEGIVGDEVSRLGPPEGFRLGVSDVDVPENGLPKPASAAMNPSSELLVGRLGEPPLMVRMRRQRVCWTGGTFFPSIASVGHAMDKQPLATFIGFQRHQAYTSCRIHHVFLSDLPPMFVPAAMLIRQA